MPRLLLVEDEPLLARTLAEYLTRSGFEVCVAGEGREVRGALASGGWDAVVLDLFVAGLAAEETVRSLLEDPEGPVVVVVSGGPPAGEIEPLLDSPRAAFLGKPFRPDALVRRLHALLGD